MTGSSLPAEVTTFIGRRHELNEARKKLANARLVTLTGTGGVGKTRLALRVADSVRRAFSDGVWLVELAPLHEAGLLAQTVLDAMGIRDQSTRPSLDVLVRYLERKQALLVLDNCEHLLDDCAQLVRTLLRRAPNLRVLVTSRQWLGLEGEHILVVPPLSVPNSDTPAEALAQYEAVKLLADRAAAEAPGFDITKDNVAAVIKLCQWLDGVPLAIELAAVRLGTVSIEEMLNRLDDRFVLLAGKRRAVIPHHETLQATLDWSYELCNAEERLLWSRLSVFSGGFDLAAAEHVCAYSEISANEVLDLVASLVHKSIVLMESNGPRTRYQMLETIRQYGQQRLREANEEAMIRQRHRDYYRQFAMQAAQDWFGAQEVEWLDRIRQELPNLRSVLDFCVTNDGQAEIGLEIALNLTRTRFWFFAGTLGEGRRWIERTRALSPKDSPYLITALALNSWFALCQGDQSAAVALLEECRELSAELKDQASLGAVMYIEGTCALLVHGDLTAMDFLVKAREQFLANGSLGDAHMALMFLAFAAAFVGDQQQAQEASSACHADAEENHAEWATSWSLWTLGLAEVQHGDPHRAEELFVESLRRQRAIKDQWGPVWGVEALAWATAKTDPKRAAGLLGAADILRRLTGVTLSGLVPFDQAHIESEKIIRTALTSREYDQLTRRSEMSSVTQVIDFAIGERNSRNEKPPSSDTNAHELTKRERQVADLIAQGVSNKDIAAELVISPRTADTHVQHIFTKLGFTSRSQVAAWAIEQRYQNSDN